MTVPSLAYLSAKSLKIPENVYYLNTSSKRINVPMIYVRTQQNKLQKKVARKNRRGGNITPYGFMFGNKMGHFNYNAPAVYKNKNWLYFHNTGYRNEPVLFFNSKISKPVYIHPRTGKRRPAKRTNVKGLELTKRSKYNTWNSYVNRSMIFLGKKRI
jgi:hypothetical protein